MAIIDTKQLKALKKELRMKQQSNLHHIKGEVDIEKTDEKCDSQLFREAISGVTPLKKNPLKITHNNHKPKAKLLKTRDLKQPRIHDPLSDELHIDEVSSEEIISFCQNGIQKNVFAKLRRGKYPISDELDLHGITVKQAKQTLLGFLHDSIQFDNYCLRIIHGKGHRSGSNKPIIKAYLNHWLREHHRVLAFHTALPRDGGAGAVYLILKKQA